MERFAWVLSVLLVIAGCGEAMSPEGGGGGQVQLQIKDYAGIMDLVESHRGKVVVMDAWSTWCEPCIKEFPGLVELNKKYGRDKVACVSLSFDYAGTGRPEDVQDDVLKFLRQQGATFDNILSSDSDSELYAKFDVDSIPVVFVYDRQGKLARRFDNSDPAAPAFTYQDVDALVAELVKP